MLEFARYLTSSHFIGQSVLRHPYAVPILETEKGVLLSVKPLPLPVVNYLNIDTGIS